DTHQKVWNKIKVSRFLRNIARTHFYDRTLSRHYEIFHLVCQYSPQEALILLQSLIFHIRQGLRVRQKLGQNIEIQYAHSLGDIIHLLKLREIFLTLIGRDKVKEQLDKYAATHSVEQSKNLRNLFAAEFDQILQVELWQHSSNDLVRE